MNNVLIVITKGVVGGAQHNAMRSALLLKKNGIGVTIATGDGYYIESKCKETGIPFHRFRNLKRTRNPIKNIFFIFEFIWFIKEREFNIVHSYSANALFTACAIKLYKKKTKTIFTMGGLSCLDPLYELHPFMRNMYWLIMKILIFFVDEVIFENNTNKNAAIEIGLVKRGRVESRLIDIAHMNFYSRKEARDFFQSKISISFQGKWVLGCVGRLAYQKNYSFLINVLSNYPKFFSVPIIVLVIGDGPERESLIRLRDSLGLEETVYFLGEIIDAYSYIKGFDLLCNCSRYEGTSITILEGLIAGIPLLASDISSNREVLEYSKEQLFTLNNETDFILKLVRLHQDQALYQKLIWENLSLSRKYLFSETDTTILNKYLTPAN